ncbi:hypothetical protein [Kitasatospora sp. NPDC004289]
MNLKRSVVGLLGAAALLPALLAGAGSAQAVQAAPAAITAGSPSASGVTPDYYGYDRDMFNIPCNYGSLCAAVNDPVRQKWAVFRFDPCRLYSVSNWEGTGYLTNNQTPNTVSRFYGGSGQQLFTSTAGSGSSTRQLTVNWSPVWSLRNC